MNRIIIADKSHIDDITALRVEQQIEDWGKTLNIDFSDKGEKFSEITRNHLFSHLNKSLYFALMLVDEKAVAMCAVEELEELPQITVCGENNGRHGCIVSVYTQPKYRGRGYQQLLIKELLRFAKAEGFNDITLTTNTSDAKHIYEKAGFKYISDKYFLGM